MKIELHRADVCMLVCMAKSALRHTQKYVDEHPETLEAFIARTETIPQARRIIAELEGQL